MPGRLTDPDIRSILNNRFGAVAMPAAPTAYWLGLATTAPIADGSGFVEVSATGTAYARLQITNNTTNFPSLSAGRGPKTNGVAFTFATATANWGTVVAWILFGSQTGTTAADVRTYGLINPGGTPPGVAILNGETRSFPAGSLTISAPGN